MQKLLDVIEDLDDVQALYHNAEICAVSVAADRSCR